MLLPFPKNTKLNALTGVHKRFMNQLLIVTPIFGFNEDRFLKNDIEILKIQKKFGDYLRRNGLNYIIAALNFSIDIPLGSSI